MGSDISSCPSSCSLNLGLGPIPASLHTPAFAATPSGSLLTAMSTSAVRRSSRLASRAGPRAAVSREPRATTSSAHVTANAADSSNWHARSWPAPLIRCKLLKRYKRFLADVQMPGSADVVTAHCPNPGSMRGLRVDEMPDVLVSKAIPGSSRKLEYTLEAIFLDEHTIVGCNTSLPNDVVSDWLTSASEARTIFGNYVSVRREVVYGVGSGSRIDFVLEYATESSPPFYVEVKNVTMSWDDGSMRVAVFPDSKTVRGQKHLRELVDVVQRKGARGCVLYFVNRQDCKAFAPCSIDPKYVQLFHEAEVAGVCAIPLVFALNYTSASQAAEFNYVGRLPLHPRSGP